MTAEALRECVLHYCVVCGPRICEELEDGTLMFQHANIPHPECVYYTDEERNPQ